MVDRINPILPRNPDIFPVAPTGLKRIEDQDQEREREERRREREREEQAREREARRAAVRRGAAPGEDDDGRPHVDLIA